jgi:hypothetical protein
VALVVKYLEVKWPISQKPLQALDQLQLQRVRRDPPGGVGGRYVKILNEVNPNVKIPNVKIPTYLVGFTSKSRLPKRGGKGLS